MKFGGGGKRAPGKNSFPPTPFLFARPIVQFGARSAAENGNTGSPSAGSKSLAILSICFVQLKN
jgi:hypothetical protein